MLMPDEQGECAVGVALFRASISNERYGIWIFLLIFYYMKFDLESHAFLSPVLLPNSAPPIISLNTGP